MGSLSPCGSGSRRSGSVTQRAKQAVERFAETGASKFSAFRASTRPSSASASATTGSGSTTTQGSYASSASATAARPINGD